MKKSPDHGDGLTIARYRWRLLPLHIVTTLAYLVLRIVMVILGLFACAIGVFWVRVPTPYIDTEQQFPKWLWLWDSVGGTLPEPWWWQGSHWSLKLGAKFSLWWWRAVRNPASNFTRHFPGGDDGPEDWIDVFTTPSSHRATMWPGGHAEKLYWQIRWDSRRPWLSEYYFVWVWGEARYFVARAGFKLGRQFTGLGYTFRLLPWKRFDRLK